LPVAIIKLLAIFIKEMKFVKHMSDYSISTSESHLVDEYATYSILGKPHFDLNDYAIWLKENQFYNYLMDKK